MTKEELIQEHHFAQTGHSVAKAHHHAEITLQYAEQESLRFLEWIASREGEYKLTLVDNDWYWDSDKDGDQPLTTEYLFQLYKTKQTKTS